MLFKCVFDSCARCVLFCLIAVPGVLFCLIAVPGVLFCLIAVPGVLFDSRARCFVLLSLITENTCSQRWGVPNIFSQCCQSGVVRQ